MKKLLYAAVAAVLAGLPVGAHAAKMYGPGVSDTEIKLGETVPLSGPVSGYGVLSKGALAFFALINDRGGVNGRKINLIIADDGYSPPRTVEQTRKLVELDGVFLMFAPVGTAPNVAIRKYLNARKVPQLFLQSGISLWNDPAHYPWSMAGLPNYATESRQYARYILAHKPNARIAILYQHDDFGKEYLDGLTEGLGTKAGQMIVGRQSFELADPTVDSQVIALQATGADTFLIASTSKQAVQALKKAHEIGWRPLTFVSFVAASIDRTLIPAGVEASRGVISATVFMDPHDPEFDANPEMRMYVDWMKRYYPSGDKNEGLNLAAAVMSELLVDVLKRCGDELTRENVMKQAAHFDHFAAPLLWPGITISSSPTDYNLYHELQLVRFDGKYLRPFNE